MPLNKSGSQESVGQNISQLQKDKYPHKQAIAIALDIQRRAKMANGGAPPWFIKSEAHDMDRYGMMHGATPGRADMKPVGVRGGSYVVPADIVSSLGQGNSMAGANSLNRMLKMGPYGTQTPRMGMGRTPIPHMSMPRHFSGGGEVPIKVSDGEFLIPPDKVAEIGGGDVNHGHDILDHIVKLQRQKTIQHLSSLPPPRNSEQGHFDDGGGIAENAPPSQPPIPPPPPSAVPPSQTLYNGNPVDMTGARSDISQAAMPNWAKGTVNTGMQYISGEGPNNAVPYWSGRGGATTNNNDINKMLGNGQPVSSYVLPLANQVAGGSGAPPNGTTTPGTTGPTFPPPIIPDLNAILGQQIPGPTSGPSYQNNWQNFLPFQSATNPIPNGQPWSPYPQYPQYAPGAPQANLAQATAPQIPGGQQGGWWTGSQNPWWIGNANGGRIRRGYQTDGRVSDDDRAYLNADDSQSSSLDDRLNQVSGRSNWQNSLDNFLSYSRPTPYEQNHAQDARAYATYRMRRPYGVNE